MLVQAPDLLAVALGSKVVSAALDTAWGTPTGVAQATGMLDPLDVRLAFAMLPLAAGVTVWSRWMLLPLWHCRWQWLLPPLAPRTTSAAPPSLTLETATAPPPQALEMAAAPPLPALNGSGSSPFATGDSWASPSGTGDSRPSPSNTSPFLASRNDHSSTSSSFGQVVPPSRDIGGGSIPLSAQTPHRRGINLSHQGRRGGCLIHNPSRLAKASIN
ncbi:UNVERIFIED_CONTAM: hypothetical protein FKN15_054322 [Acipenser sinensis]